MKKSLALVLAAVMMMVVIGSAFAAADYAATPTGSVTITGLEEGDYVFLYEVLRWDNQASVNNWAPLNAYSDVEGINNYSEMKADKAAAIAAIAKGETPVNGASGTAVGANKTFTCDNLPVGMYVALVKSAGNTVYNPMIVSVNYNGGDSSNAKSGELDASTANLTSESGATIAKKKPITATKTVDPADTDADDAKTIKAGDKVPFIVTTELPTYADNWINPFFKVTDTLSDGLKLNTGSIKVTIAGYNNGEAYTETTNGILTITENSGLDGYEINFDKALLKEIKTNATVTIKYTATVQDSVIVNANVNRENNTVTVEFSNNPKNEQDHETITERTNHYTFGIDVNISGDIQGQDITSELIKIGVDSTGTVITEWKTSDLTTWQQHLKLAGAEFTLTKVEINDNYEDSTQLVWTATSGSEGQISFKGLEAGIYTLTETKAPDGFVKDAAAAAGIKVEITATYLPDEIVNGVMEHHRLESYTITIADTATSTYTVVNEASDTVTTSAVSSDNETFPIVNTHGVELPSTGGIGTTIFYVSGLLMVLGAATILVARRKADAE